MVVVKHVHGHRPRRVLRSPGDPARGRVSPRARLVVTGCWAQTSPEDVARLREVDLVVGNADKHACPTLLGRPVGERVSFRHRPARDARGGAPRAGSNGRSRAFLQESRTAASIGAPSASCRSPASKPEPRAEGGAPTRRAARRGGPSEIVLTGVDMGQLRRRPRPAGDSAARRPRGRRGPGAPLGATVLVAAPYFTPELLRS